MKPSEWDTVAGRILYCIDLYKKEVGGLKDRPLSRQIFGKDGGTRISVVRDRSQKGHTGDDMPVASVVQLARFFKVPIAWLADNEGWPSEKAREHHEGLASSRRPAGPPKLKAVRSGK